MVNNINIRLNASMKRGIIFITLLVFLLVLGSSTVGAENNDPDPELAPDNPDFVEYQENDVSTQPEAFLDGHEAGLVPAPVDLSYLDEISVTTSSDPDYYDLRTLDKVTTVKDQGTAGTCWAFASYSSLESYLMPDENWDFSENNMKNLLSSAYPEGFDRDPNDGGNRIMATAYLARWSGPVLEADDPYSDISEESPTDLALGKHVQDVLFLPKRASSLDNKFIKWAVQNYGAVYTAFYYNSSCYSPENCSYFFNGTLGSNHAVAIVGWDDSFDRNYFSEIPPGDGAFIVKNSWGPDWGEDGYFYISYYDSNVGLENSVFTAEAPDNYEYIYQYDPFGWVSSLGYGTSTAWCANIFTAESSELLKAVSFYTTASTCSYEIYIYTDPGSGPINQSGPVLSQNGTSLTAGYHTIPLDSEVLLKDGQKFSVVLKLTTLGYNYPIALEKPKDNWSSKATSNAGESFISSSGTTWRDITSYSSYVNVNVCIKAFTDQALLPSANFSTNVTEGYAPLSVQFTDLSENATERSWDFENDGIANSMEENPVYVYTTPGIYTVNLTASNENGTDSKTGTITVLEIPLPPVAMFYSDVTQGYAPLCVQFRDISVNATERSWDFGDDSSSTDVAPVHTYEEAGKYTVVLTVKNISGTDTETKSKFITVTKEKKK